MIDSLNSSNQQQPFFPCQSGKRQYKIHTINTTQHAHYITTQHIRSYIIQIQHNIQIIIQHNTQYYKYNTTYTSIYTNQVPGNDKVYVAENSGRISVFQLDGQFSHIIGSGHIIIIPWHVAVSSNDQLLVANVGHHCIFMHIYIGW